MREKIPSPPSPEGKEENKKSIEELRAELLATGKVSGFEDSGYEPLAVPEGMPTLVNTGMELVNQYLGLPIVTDAEGAFVGHRQRRVWRTKLSLDQRGVYEGNAISRNNISGAIGGVELLLAEVDSSFDDTYKELRAEFEDGWGADDDHPDGYFSLEKKKEFVTKKLRPFLDQLRSEVAKTK